MADHIVDPDTMPLTYEALQEERAFDGAQRQAGGQLRRIASGYVLTAPGVVRHFADMGEARAHLSGNRPNE